MPNAQPSLVAILEAGGSPHLVSACKAAGFDVVVCPTMRKGLSSIKRLHPQVVVAEFVFGPIYPTRISNFESLLAGLQRDVPTAKLIAALYAEDEMHLDRVVGNFPLFARLQHPVSQDELVAILAPLARDTVAQTN